MRRRILVLVSGVLCFQSLFGQVKFYNTSTMQVGPGVIHKKYHAPVKPWMLNVLQIDLTNPYIIVESMKANNLLASRETTSSMAARNSYQMHRVVGSTNADFYDGYGIPIGAQVLNGQLLKLPVNRSVFGVDAQKRPMAGVVSFSGQVVANNQSRTINGVNSGRGTNDLILFNRFYSSSTGTNQYGSEVLITPLSQWSVNTTVQCMVENIASAAGDMGIPGGKAVLSGNGTAETFLLNHIQVGDTIAINLSLLPGLADLQQVVGGFPKIVRNGQNYALQGYAEEGGGSTFATDRHPRTAIGFSADSTILYMITIDGRQASSIGMNLIELADFMVDIGVYYGINLDGGGSTTMVVNGQIENSPSEAERPVSNSIGVVSSAPIDSLYTIQIKPDNQRILIGKSLRFESGGWDQYYNPKQIETINLEYQLTGDIGTVDNTGLFRAGWQKDSGHVVAHYNGLMDTAWVFIKTINELAISPKQVTTDTSQSIRFFISVVDEDNLPATFAANAYQWQSLNPDIGQVDSMGIFKAQKEGTTKIVASLAGKSDTATVHVMVLEGSAVIDSLDQTDHWSVGGRTYDEEATQISIAEDPKTIGHGALKLDYQFVRSSTDRSYVYLNTDIQIVGLPDTIYVDVKSDGKEHRVYFIISDDNNEIFKGSTGQFATRSEKYDTLKVAIDDFNPDDPSSNFNFPIRFRRIETRMGFDTEVGGINTGTLFFDNLRIVYPDYTSHIPLHDSHIPAETRLYQNYPNPFNSRTTIQFQTSLPTRVELNVFDVTGRQVTELISRTVSAGVHRVNWETQTIASGVYFYQLKTDEFQEVRKMILLR